MFGLNKNTPDYIVRRKLKEYSMYTESVSRAVKYEDKVIMNENNNLNKETFRRKMMKLGGQNKNDEIRNKRLEKYEEDINSMFGYAFLETLEQKKKNTTWKR